MKTKTINVYTDPGHGWAKVSRAELIRFGILDRISHYSYQRKDHVYLEEDCDLSVYLVALRNAGYTVSFREHVCRERQSKIRGYDRFVKGTAQ